MKSYYWPIALAVLLLSTAGDSQGQLVTAATDTGAGSLRAVVSSAAAGATITFSSALSGATITLTSGEILLGKNLTIDASALTAGIRINGNHASRIFEISSAATVSLASLTLTNGFSPSGGAILNGGNLSMNRCTITGCAVSSGGAGGGIYNNQGILGLTNCTVAGNSAIIGNAAGGGIFNLSGGSRVTLNQCTVSANSALTGGGFQSFNLGSNNVVFFNSIVAGNTSTSGPEVVNTPAFLAGPSLTNGNPLLAPLANYGGPTPTMPPLPNSPAINAGSDANGNLLTIDQRGLSRISGAHADIGAVENQYLVVQNLNDSGAGSLRALVAAAPIFSAISFSLGLSGQTIALSGGELLLTNTVSIDASALPGGITLSGNNANRIFNLQPGPGGPNVGLNCLTIVNGSAPGSGGGAIYAAPGSTLNITRCAFTGSSAVEGGAILNDGVLQLENSTFSGNSGGYGGALQCRAPTTLTHCTIAGNNSSFGGGIFNKFSTLRLNDSIVCNNASLDIINQLATLVFTNVNFIQAIQEDRPSSPTTGPVPLNLDPQLLAFGNYGGPTPSMPPASGASPVVDAGGPTGVALDQRGLARIIGSAEDVGAVEFYYTNSNLQVTTATDTVAGSLRHTVEHASRQGTTTITFAPSLAGQSIQVVGGQIVLDRNLILDGSGFSPLLQINAGHANRLFYVQTNTTVSINQLALINGKVSGNEGARGVDGTTSTIATSGTDGLPAQGGAIYNAGTLTLNQSFLSQNLAYGGGGGYGGWNTNAGFYPGNGGNAGEGQGGAIYNEGTLTISGSTFSENGATGGTGGQPGFGPYVPEFSTYGLGVRGYSGSALGGSIYNTGLLAIVQSTVANSSASGGEWLVIWHNARFYSGAAGTAHGGAIYNAGTLSLVQSTISSNTAAGGIENEFFRAGAIGTGGGIYSLQNFSLENTIVCGNAVDSIGNDYLTPEVGGSGYATLIASLTNGSPSLMQLGYYGGPTPTMPPLPGSPVIDAGSDSVTADYATDQRGFARLSGAHVDLGAVELQVASQPFPVGSPMRLSDGSSSLAFTNVPGGSFTLFSSTNVTLPFNTWSNLGSVVELPVGSGHFQFTIPATNSQPRQFYRVRSP